MAVYGRAVNLFANYRSNVIQRDVFTRLFSLMQRNSMKNIVTLFLLFFAIMARAQDKSKSPFCFTINPEIVSVSDIRTSLAVFGTIGGMFERGFVVGTGAGFLMTPDHPGGHVPFFLQSSYMPVRKRMNPFVSVRAGLDLYSHDYKGTDAHIAYVSGGLFTNVLAGLLFRIKGTSGIFIQGSFVLFETKQHYSYDRGEIGRSYTNIFLLGVGYKF
jgi:hypothetical protein